MGCSGIFRKHNFSTYLCYNFFSSNVSWYSTFKNESSIMDSRISSRGVRVIIGPIIGFALIKFLNLNGFAAGVLLIQSCMPSAVLTYLVGSMYSEKKVVDSVASVIVTSTIMSFISIPIVVYYSLKYFQ